MTPGLAEALGASVVARISVVGTSGPAGHADAVVLRVQGTHGHGQAPDVLDDGERDRLARFARAADRRRYRLAHTALRVILGARTGAHPADLRFARAACPRCGGPHGRPVLAGSPGVVPEFSLSHGGDLVAVAVADRPVGVDVDRITARAGRHLVALLHPRERQLVLRSPAAARDAVLTRVWTRKEAYLKGLGVGLSRELHADDVTAPLRGWTVVDQAAEDHSVALAVCVV